MTFVSAEALNSAFKLYVWVRNLQAKRFLDLTAKQQNEVIDLAVSL